MNLESIADKLQTDGVGVQGTSIFINMMKADATGLLLRDPFGGSMLDHELHGYRKTSFQLIARAGSMAAAKALMTAAVASLCSETERDFTGMRVKYMRQRHDPLPFPLSVGNQTELLVNIDVALVLV